VTGVVGSLYGYALQRPDRRETPVFLYSIDVRPEYWNRGIGTALVEQFINEGRRAGAFEIWVLTNESNKGAMAMYAHAGLQRRNVGDVMLELALTP
jgi:GNAT superfamily N-acetyltransferase